MHIGMFLELATTSGAIAGALLAAVVAPSLLLVLLGIVLLGSAGQQALRLGEELAPDVAPSGAALRLRLWGSYRMCSSSARSTTAPSASPSGSSSWASQGSYPAFSGSARGRSRSWPWTARCALPMKVSSATSNFMIGVTAAASAGIYLGRGDVDPTIAVPVALGVLAGATLGARLLPRLSNRRVRLIFLPVLVVIGLETLARGLGVGL